MTQTLAVRHSVCMTSTITRGACILTLSILPTIVLAYMVGWLSTR